MPHFNGSYIFLNFKMSAMVTIFGIGAVLCSDSSDLKSTTNILLFEPVHEISNNVVCATSKASDQPAHMRSLIRAFASRLSIL